MEKKPFNLKSNCAPQSSVKYKFKLYGFCLSLNMFITINILSRWSGKTQEIETYASVVKLTFAEAIFI